MSLVGSLEDLGLGDILQVISLSRKSGVLLLRTDLGNGRIIFRDGLIRGAFREGDSTSLRELVAGSETVPPAELDAAWEQARAEGVGLDTVLIDRSLSSAEFLEELCRENVEGAVMQMFRWETGEFSFEVRDDIIDEETFSSSGVNPQFLALDYTRRADEKAGDKEEDPSCDSLMFDGEGEFDAAEGEPLSEEAIVTIEESHSPEEPILTAEPMLEPEPLAAVEEASDAAPPCTVASESRPPSPVIAIDTDLAVLEWVKQGLSDTFPRVHIFQRSELGISRIRQYLARAEEPLVLLSANAPADPLSGANDCVEIIQRLRAHSRQMPIVLMVEPGEDPLRGRAKESRPDAIAEKPTPSHLADPRCLPLRDEYAAGLRDALVARTSRRCGADVPPSPTESLSPDSLARLKQVSARIRDPSSRGEVLPHVLHYASETLSRVAMFMIRDDTAQGIAQVGLQKAGGPDQRGLREVTLPHREPAWFRQVLDRRSPVRAAPTDDGDQRLAVLLGNAIPGEAYVAPIESGEQIVALLYADNLPGDEPIGDTSALEVVLHEAGLALDRAWLERVLEAAES